MALAPTLTTDRALIDQFLGLLFRDKPPEHRLLLWTLQSKLSYWAQDPVAIAERAAHLGARADVYIGCCPTVVARDQHQRALASQASGMPGRWGDFDVKPGQFPSVEAAVAFLLGLPHRPTLIVGSGHGVQAWWLYYKYWVFADEGERASAAWQMVEHTRALRAAAVAQGYGCDATQDLARILRIPGTWNLKDDPRPVTLLYQEGPRYETLHTPPPPEAAVVIRGTDPAALPTTDAVERNHVELDNEALLSLAQDSVRRLTWCQVRRDMGDPDDYSQSAYDQSLANFAAWAGWADQPILDLLVYYRAYHAHPPKHPSYLPRTLSKARASAPEPQAPQGDAEPPPAGPLVGDQRVVYLTRLREALGLPQLERVVAWQHQTPTYQLELAAGEPIPLGHLADLMKPQALRLAVLCVTRRLPRTMKQPEWEEQVVRSVVLLAEPKAAGDENTKNGQTREWIECRLGEDKAQPGPSDTARKTGLLFYYTLQDGRLGLAIPSQKFSTWVTQTFQRLEPDELQLRIAAMGGTHVTVNYRREDGGRGQMRCQWLPADWDGDVDEERPIEL